MVETPPAPFPANVYVHSALMFVCICGPGGLARDAHHRGGRGQLEGAHACESHAVGQPDPKSVQRKGTLSSGDLATIE